MCMRKARGIVQLAVVAMMVDLSINGIGVICRLLFVDVIICGHYYFGLYYFVLDDYRYIYLCVCVCVCVPFFLT